MKQRAAAVGSILIFLSSTALPQQYPTRPIRVVAAQSAGSSVDTIARIVMAKVSETLGQQLVIDNRGGAGGTIGVEICARAAPDGYTILAVGSSAMINARFTYKSLAFDVFKDFDAISRMLMGYGVLVVNPSVAARSVKDLIALAQAQSGKLMMSSAGIGSSSHLAGVMFTSMAAINSVHVPYKGGGPMTAAIVGGEAQWAISPAAAVMGHIKAGRLRALAISSKERSPLLPELPTIAEAGVPGYEYTNWNGVFVPKGTPQRIVNTLHAAIQKALADAEVKHQFASQGVEPAGSVSPAEFDRFFRADFERVAKVIRIAGIKPE